MIEQSLELVVIDTLPDNVFPTLADGKGHLSLLFSQDIVVTLPKEYTQGISIIDDQQLDIIRQAESIPVCIASIDPINQTIAVSLV